MYNYLNANEMKELTMYIKSVTIRSQVTRDSIDRRLSGLKKAGYIIVDNRTNVQAIYNDRVEYSAKQINEFWAETFH